MKSQSLIYYCNGIGSVFDSQVLEFLNILSTKNIFRHIHLVLGIRNNNEKTLLLNKTINNNINLVIYKSYPNYPIFNFINRLSIKLANRRITEDLSKTVVHTRGELLAWHLLNIFDRKYYNRILPDIRGVGIIEFNEFSGLKNHLKKFKLNNYRSALNSLSKFKRINTVSNSLKDYLVYNFNISNSTISTIPSLAGCNFIYNENLRIQARNELGLHKDDILIVFSSGGTAGWQNNENIKILADKGYKILNLSKIVITHKNILNKFISYDKMNIYLNASDIAFISRVNSVVNRVASPVKFSEYICCGLPVLTDGNVELINAFINEYGLGKIVNDITRIDHEIVNKLINIDRKKLSKIGIQKFGIENIVNYYISIYNQF